MANRESCAIRTVGFIGLGRMGAPMAAHLLRADHPLLVHTRTRAKSDPLVVAGARWVDDPAELAHASDALITMVGGPADVETLYRDTIFDAARPGTLLIDMTSSSPRLAQALHIEAQERGLALLDAPVTGGVAGAQAASLAIFVGGNLAHLEAARQVLDRLGKRITYCGPAGAGQRLKITNQTVVAATVLGIAEGLMLAARGGLDVKALLPTLLEGTAGGFLLRAYGEKMIDGDNAATFSVDHFIKDMSIALEESESLGLDAPMLRTALAQFERLRREQGGALGMQAIAELYR